MATEDPQKPKPKIPLAAKLALMFGISGAGAVALFSDKDNSATVTVATPEQPPIDIPPDPVQPDNFNKGPRTPTGRQFVPGHGRAKSNPSANTKQLKEAPRSEVIILSTDSDLSNDDVKKLLSRLSIRNRWTSENKKESPCVILDTTGVEYKSPAMQDFVQGTGPVIVIDTGDLEEGHALYWRTPSSTGEHLRIAQSDGTLSPAAFKKAEKYLTGTVPPEMNPADEEVKARIGIDGNGEAQKWQLRLEDGKVITLFITAHRSKVPIPTGQTPQPGLSEK